MNLRCDDGRLTLQAVAARVHLRGFGPEVEYEDRSGREAWRPRLRPVENGFVAEQDNGLTLRIDWHRQADALVLSAAIANHGAAAVRLTRVAPLALPPSGACQIGPAAADWSVLRQGYQSWTGTRSFRASETDRNPISHLLQIGLIDIRRPSPERPGCFRSDMFAAVKNLRSGDVLVAGFLSCRSAFGSIEVYIEDGQCTRWAATLDYDDVELAPGDQLTCDPVWLAAGDDEHALLAAYADASGAAMQARVPGRNPVGWCSWYYYFTRIDEARIAENAAALAALRPRFPCDYVQVDDGYQAAIGDWLLLNTRFPNGMGAMAARIRAHGFDAGIWTAPFIARSGSQLLREHRDWFVKNRRGQPRFALWNPVWGIWGSCYALDTTHPGALEWLRRTFRTIAQEWGYRVLKLDFLFAAALPGQRYDPRATRAQALRRGLEAIRAGAGDEAFLLGCGCPLGPAIGVVDAMRIGPDVAPFWSNALSRTLQRDEHGLATKHAVRNTLTRAFLHRRWWLNDPDCLMVRDTRTQLTLDEVRSLATVIALTDGMIVLSDRVEQLSPQRRELLDRALQLAGGQAEVVDLMAANIPELLVSRRKGQTVVAVFNFANHSQHKHIDLHRAGIWCDDAALGEWWTAAPISVRSGTADLGEIPAHACRVLVLTESAPTQAPRPEAQR